MKLQAIYEAVFRQSTEQPGFYYQDLGKAMDSRAFRQLMVNLKNGLSYISKHRSGKQLVSQSIGRFDHQHSSMFHRDSAAAHSFLMLGYEPTQVDSRVYVADYSKFIESQEVSLETYFGGDQDVNIAENEELLISYTTVLTPFPKDHYRLLLLNNSKSFEEKTFGVFHRGEVSKKNNDEDRIINYMMLYLGDQSLEESQNSLIVEDFINTNKVNR